MGVDLTKNLLIGRTKILFAFIDKQSMLTNNGCFYNPQDDGRHTIIFDNITLIQQLTLKGTLPSF